MENNYLRLFETQADFEEARFGDYQEPWVSYTEETGEVKYNKSGRELWYSEPLTFEILTDGAIVWNVAHQYWSDYGKTISYSKNGGEWTSIKATQDGVSISVVAGDIIKFKGNNSNGFANPANNGTTKLNRFINSTASFNLKGNIMSLISSSGFESLTQFTSTSKSMFQELFRETNVIDASYLILPAKTLQPSCYRGLFYKCSNLIAAPELPATTLVDSCYSNMFYECTSLTTSPKLPATTLDQYCYYYMFYNCTNLTTVSELPATTLAYSCYNDMFYGCASLVNAPALPATTLAESCYANMFSYCTSLTKAPELLATTLAPSCYWYMFYKCSNLNYIKCLATDISATNCTNSWTTNVSATGTFIKNANTTWTTGNNGIPTNWTVQTASS